MLPLEEACARLEAEYGAPPSPFCADLFQQLLWENVGYLADDRRREEAFEALRQLTDLSPERICAASPDALTRVCRIGGIHPELRAERLRTIAQITLTVFDGDLSPILSLPPKQAIKALCRFPAIGVPGAEKLLLFAGAQPLFALESNGLRVLLRTGYGEEVADYAKAYKSVQSALEGSYPLDCAWLTRAHQLLRQHGQETCRRSAPDCPRCPLVDGCRTGSLALPEQDGR